MYTVKIGENQYDCNSLYTLGVWASEGRVNEYTVVYDHLSREWKHAGTLINFNTIVSDNIAKKGKKRLSSWAKVLLIIGILFVLSIYGDTIVNKLDDTAYSLQLTARRLEASQNRTKNNQQVRGDDKFEIANVSFRPGYKGNSIKIIGEITNKSGRDYRRAWYNMSIYGKENILVDSIKIVIYNFNNGKTKSFSEESHEKYQEIIDYKIDFDFGFDKK
ncbi:MAG: hypothetical protein P9M14_01375 [Candidatus Alcyoniella australis]|nr:hypothetical protein [Candidatus Alcyoniella australis]